jgi:hypothetical protein
MNEDPSRYRWQIIQGGIVVAEGSGDDLESVKTDMVHYAVQYVQDGPIKIVGSPELGPTRA